MTEHPDSTADVPSPGAANPTEAGLRAAAGVALALAAAGVVAACSSTEVGFNTGPTRTAEMQFSIQVPGATSSSSLRAGPTVSRSVAVSDSVTVDSVDFAIREIQVGKQGVDCLFAPSGGGGDGGDGLECQEFTLGTIIRTVPVDVGTEDLTIVDLEPATWDHVAFQLNVLTQDNQEDIQVIGQTNRDDMTGASVYLRALRQTPTGVDTVELRLDPEGARVVAAPEPLTLEDQEGGVATFVVDVASWFDDGAGGTIDPRDAKDQEALREDIKTNIDDSFSLVLSPR